MNKKPTLEELGLDDPSTTKPAKKTWLDIANEVDEQPAAIVPCPYCGSKISPNVAKCANCSEWIKRPKSQWNGIAAVLSFFVPGLGQLYRGNIVAGVLLFVLTIASYFLTIFVGIVLHLIAIIDAGVRGK